MKNTLALNVLALALAASFAGSTLAQDPNTTPVPPVDRTNPTPPVNPEATRDPVQADEARERAQDATGNPSAQDFVAKALKSGRMEVAAARTAQQRATDPRVKQLAQTIERDHTQLNGRLEALDREGAGMANRDDEPGARPTGMGAVDDAGTDDKGKIDKADKLAGLQGAAYDREYVAMQVKMHEKSIAMFEAASTKGDNAEVQALAREALPTLRKHAEQARTLHGSLAGN